MVQIAFFTADWNYELVSETLEGINSFLEKRPPVYKGKASDLDINPI